MQVLILSDSLALPRQSPEKVDLHSSWPYRLRKLLGGEFVQVSIGAATSSDLLKQSYYYQSLSPDIVFVQCGIVDLAPRAFLTHEIDFFKRYRITRFLIRKLTENKRRVNTIRNLRHTTYVSLKEFERNLKAFKRKFGDKLYWINVPANINGYDDVVPGIQKNITAYNATVVATIGTRTVDISKFSNNEVMSDFHHLNDQGHLKLTEVILATLKQTNVIK